MDDRTKKYLFDIKESIESIDSYLAGKADFNSYQKNKMLRRSTERELEIIGEALSKIDKIDQNIIITEKKQIVGLRNRVIHNYDDVDNTIIWGIIIRHLPILKSEVNKLLENK